MSEEPTQNLPQDGVRLILARLDAMDSRLSALEDKVDRRLQETRPIWEQVLVRLERLEGEMTGLREDLRSGFRRFEGQIGLLAGDTLKVRADQQILEERMGELESKAT